MTFEEILDQAVAMLQRRGRVTYRTLKRQFDLDDQALEGLKEQLLYSQPQVVDDEGKGLTWTGDPAPPKPKMPHGVDTESRFHALLPDVIARIHRDKRVTYRTLQYAFGLDDALLCEIRKELTFRHLARDEQGEGLVWTSSVVAPERDTALQRAMPTTSLSPPDTSSNGPAEAPEHLSSETPSTEHAHTAPDAERRQLTVLFCDLADSTKLSQQLDPEDLREVVRAYQATAAEVIQQYEGHMAQYLGDGLLVYFGWPVAHEDDAQRAAHAGRGIVEAITTHLNPRLEAEKGAQLTVRLGVHTGPVVVH